MMRIIAMLACILMLSGCKVDLYTGLNQEDANLMIVILTNKHIESEKVVAKDGTLTLAVDKQYFVDAVEALRQHGYPRKAYQSVNDLFPSGQLVTSPAQEQVKITFLKEQSLEKMLSDIDGVISARVSVSFSQSDVGGDTVPASASVFIKYSPEINLEGFVTQIKSLVHNSVPELGYDAISVVLQPTQYTIRNDNPVSATSDKKKNFFAHIDNKKIIYISLGVAWFLCLCVIAFGVVRRRKKSVLQAG